MAQSFRHADHLPKRSGAEHALPEGLPRQRRGTTPQMLGRYPDYDVLEQAHHWDEVTRRVVLARVEEVPPLRFFSGAEIPTLRAFTDLVLAQDAEPRIPVLEMVDAKLHAGALDGFRFADMPPDPETWRIVARGLDESARERGAASFAVAPLDDGRAIVDGLSRGTLTGGAWDELNVARAWSVVMRATLSAFYSHPWSWNEIGFGGPAYPRGYMRLHVGPNGREPTEAREAFDTDPVEDVPARGLER